MKLRAVGVACAALVAIPATSHASTYRIKLTGQQTVRVEGTARSSADAVCSYARKESAHAHYAFKTKTASVRVSRGDPALSAVAAKLGVTANGRLDQATTAVGCQPTASVRERCGPTHDRGGSGLASIGDLSRKRPRIGFDILGVGSFGAECGLIAKHAPFAAPSLDDRWELTGLFRRQRTVLRGSEDSLDFVNVFDDSVQADPCEECVARRYRTTWTLSFTRVKR